MLIVNLFWIMYQTRCHIQKRYDYLCTYLYHRIWEIDSYSHYSNFKLSTTLTYLNSISNIILTIACFIMLFFFHILNGFLVQINFCFDFINVSVETFQIFFFIFTLGFYSILFNFFAFELVLEVSNFDFGIVS